MRTLQEKWAKTADDMPEGSSYAVATRDPACCDVTNNASSTPPDRTASELPADLGQVDAPATIDPRTEHLIALVKNGATLRDAARVYGISGERVRQLLKKGNLSAGELPGRAEKQRSRAFELSGGLAPVIEAMWREGMLYHEIAKLFESSCEGIHRLIYDRVPPAERSALASARLDDRRSSDERLHDGLRKAAGVLAQAPAIEADERRRAQAVIDRWLAAHPEPGEAVDVPSPTERTVAVDVTSPTEPLSAANLRSALDHFKADLRAGGLRESTIRAYVLGSSLFVRWLAGEYVPSPRADRSPAREGGRRPDRPRPAPGPARDAADANAF